MLSGAGPEVGWLGFWGRRGGGGDVSAQQVGDTGGLEVRTGGLRRRQGGGVASLRPVEPLKPPGVAADRRGVTHPQRCGVRGGVATVRPGGADGGGGAARGQARVSTERAWARVASRTKRATLPARIKMSPR